MSGETPVLLVTRNLPPLRGGMERLNQRLAQALRSRGRLRVCGPSGCRSALGMAPGEVAEAPHRPLPWFLLRTLANAIRACLRDRPRIVVAGSGLVAPVAWLCARLRGARLVVYLHGLDIVAASRVYQRFWLPAIRRADAALVNSRHTAALAAAAGVPEANIRIVHPGTDLPAPDPRARPRFRERHRLGDVPVMLSVGRLTRRKGLAEFVERVLPGIVAASPDARLVVIGGDASDAARVQDGSERERIVAAAAAAGLARSLLLLPPCDDATLAEAYQAADVLVFPVRQMAGDIEGFGMVAIEAAAHGLPTVAFAVGGVTDAVAPGRSGQLVPPGDEAGFAAATLAYLHGGDRAARRDTARAFAAGFGWERFGDEAWAAIAPAP